MVNLATPIEKLAKVGPKNLPKLKRLGIKTVKDLLWHFPSRYEDFTQTVGLGEVREVGKVVSIMGEVAKIKTTNIWRRRMSITEAHIKDADKQVRAVWFNQPYIGDSLAEGVLVSLSGKVALDKRGIYLSSPSYEKLRTTNYGRQTDLTHTGRLVPVYPETDGISSRYLRFLIKPLLNTAEKFSDNLPKSIINKYNFPSLTQAVETIHFPESLNEAETAKKRIAFDELFLFQIKSLLSRRGLSRLKAPSIIFKPELIKKFVDSLPFALTNDQRICAFEIMKDFDRGYPMNRLLNGDVGSGKTIVAIIAAYQAADSGFQTVFMAPTEILAQQHYQTITKLLSNPNDKIQMTNQDQHSNKKIKIGLLTGNGARQLPTDETENENISKDLMQRKISKGEMDIIVGTHAVIQKNVKFKNLGLIVIDEQHRFGIEQRMKLVKNQKLTPHLLSMTATPIPRTLALTVYGDLDVSLIKEKPKNRKKIITKVFTKDKSSEVYSFVEKEILSGRQAFVVCPRIDHPDAEVDLFVETKSQNVFRDLQS